jgi:hypothetical protein
MKQEPSHDHKECKGKQRPKDSKLHNVGEVLEELLASHVVACSKQDSWQSELEEDVCVELERKSVSFFV